MATDDVINPHARSEKKSEWIVCWTLIHDAQRLQNPLGIEFLLVLLWPALVRSRIFDYLCCRVWGLLDAGHPREERGGVLE